MADREVTAGCKKQLENFLITRIEGKGYNNTSLAYWRCKISKMAGELGVKIMVGGLFMLIFPSMEEAERVLNEGKMYLGGC